MIADLRDCIDRHGCLTVWCDYNLSGCPQSHPPVEKFSLYELLQSFLTYDTIELSSENLHEEITKGRNNMKLSLGDNIRRLRRARDLTQEQLADRLGVTYQSVSRWENSDSHT